VKNKDRIPRQSVNQSIKMLIRCRRIKLVFITGWLNGWITGRLAGFNDSRVYTHDYCTVPFRMTLKLN